MIDVTALPAKIRSRVEFIWHPEAPDHLIGPCWVWGGPTSSGYGKVWWEKSHRRVHRVVWRLLVDAELPQNLDLDHLCRNRPCCSPFHLEPVTTQENARRRAAVVTHCPQGHEYTEENTYTDRRGCRTCVTCKRDGNKRRRKARVAA